MVPSICHQSFYILRFHLMKYEQYTNLVMKSWNVLLIGA